MRVVSATGRTEGVRRENDFYETPPDATRAILPHLAPHGFKGTILDPCCGDGAILRVAGVWWPDAPIVGFDLVARPFATFVRDALGEEPWRPRCDLVLTNPPYSLAQAIVERAITEVAPHGGTVAMLLRLPFLASGRRIAFHRKHPADVYVLSSRPQFCASIACSQKKAGCAWKLVQAIEAPRPKTCGACGAKVTITTSDATEYAWFVWGPGRGGRWFILGGESS